MLSKASTSSVSKLDASKAPRVVPTSKATGCAGRNAQGVTLTRVMASQYSDMLVCGVPPMGIISAAVVAKGRPTVNNSNNDRNV